MVGKRRGSDLDSTDDVAEGRLDLREAWFVVSAVNGLATVPVPRKARIVIGRAQTCDLVIDDGSVSREHAAIFDIGGELRVEDLGSRNRTKVMGHALAPGETAAVRPGSVIEIGHATVLLQRGRPATPEPKAIAPDVIVVDSTMLRLHALLDVIAPSTLNVLLLGETGTGKEVFAEALHRGSPRSRAPFVRINCAGLGGSLLESELFGHERGAFTGAHAAKEGLFEAASGGTLFLDEIGEMPIDTQAKVLRVIETGEVVRLGNVTPRRIDVRYVAATHRDIQARITEESFRADLFYRLNGYTMTLPPLRERRKDIVPLAQRFLDRIPRSGHPLEPRERALSPKVQTALEGHSWPGNVRELKNVIERAHVLAGPNGAIGPSHLALSGDLPGAGASEPTTGLRAGRGSFEAQHIVAVLEQTNGDRAAAAEILGITYRTLLGKLHAHGIGRTPKK